MLTEIDPVRGAVCIDDGADCGVILSRCRHGSGDGTQVWSTRRRWLRLLDTRAR